MKPDFPAAAYDAWKTTPPDELEAEEERDPDADRDRERDDAYEEEQ